MFGVRAFAPVINPPQAAILGVGTMRRGPIVDGDTVRPGTTLNLIFAADHRILYGADAARFLTRVPPALERPDTLMS